MAHGTEDKASAIQASDALYASLLASGRAVRYERIEGADHGIQFRSQPDRNGLAEVLGRISDWFAPQ
jgi:dipeptidyl aminopeptidase/acylaminoacyl peptidase